jgi:stage V sporulation protein G
MVVTDVRVRKVTSEGKMRAVVSVTFDEVFVVHDVKVIDGDRGLFIAMPSRKATDGTFKDIAHPISPAAREMIQSAVIKAYEAEAAKESVKQENGE